MSPAEYRLAVLGHPVAHSRSPAMQNAALAALGQVGWHYEAIDVAPEEFANLVRGLADDGFIGVNVTVPHKEAALAVADRASEAAAAIGAANTLVFEDRMMRADNTDAPGLIDVLAEGASEVPASVAGDGPAADEGQGSKDAPAVVDGPDSAERFRGRPALVLGAGGAGRAVVWALAGAGMKVVLWNRTRSKAESLADDFGVEVIPPGWQGAIDPGRFEVIVNASAAGLGGGDGLAELPLDPGGFRPEQTVVDMVYGESPGSLVTAARAAGARTIDGLEVLVRQGARSLEIWTGKQPDLEVMRQAART